MEYDLICTYCGTELDFVGEQDCGMIFVHWCPNCGTLREQAGENKPKDILPKIFHSISMKKFPLKNRK